MLGRPSVISLFGPVGVGKTSLLSHFERTVRRHKPAQVVYINFGEHLAQATSNLPLNETLPQSFEEEAICYILESFAEHLNAKSTLELIHRRYTLGQKTAINTEIQRLLASTGGQVFSVVTKALIEGFTPLPALAALLRVTGEIAADKQIVDSFLELATRNERERDRLLLIKPQSIMTDALVEDLLSREKDKFVFLLDDINPDLDTLANWLRNLMQRLTANLQITWVLVSWRKISEDDWRVFPDLDFLPIEVPRWELNCLTEELVSNVWKTLKYFPSSSFEVGTTYTALGPVAEKHTLIKATREKGKELSFLPLLISEADTHPTSDQSCCESLTSSFKEWLADDELFEYIRCLAVARWFDNGIVKRLLSPSNDMEIWERLLAVGEDRFIEQRGMKRYLQPEIRYALLRYTQTHYSMKDYHTLHRPLVDLYRDRIVSRYNVSNRTSVNSSKSYDQGFRKLLGGIRNKASQDYTDILVQQQRLTENLNRSNRYGDTPELRSERFQILDQLTSLSLRIKGVSFEDLCSSSNSDEDWLRSLKPGTLLPHSQSRSDYAEWCYHAFSAHANPGPVLLDAIQRALVSGFTSQRVEPLISAIYQVADERHAEPDFLASPVFLLNLPMIETGRRSRKPRSYVKRFRAWGEHLEECLQELSKLQSETNWNSIIDLFRALVELHKLNSENLFPEAVAEATFWLAIATYETGEIYEICEEGWTERKCLREIVSLSEGFERPWWQKIRRLAQTGLQQLREKKKWDWEKDL